MTDPCKKYIQQNSTFIVDIVFTTNLLILNLYCINILSSFFFANSAAVYQWCGFKSRREKNKNLTVLKI